MLKYDSNYSRREFCKLLGITSLGISFCGLSGCKKNGISNINLKLYGTGTLNINDWSDVKKVLGYDIEFKDNGNDPGPVITKMILGTAADDFQLGGLQGGAERELAEAGVIIPWDISKLPNWNQMWDWAKAIPYTRVNGKQYGLPIVINADSIIYLPEFTGGKIDSYAAVFDKKFKGRTGMEDAWINSAIFTAIFLKESGEVKIKDPGDLDEAELEAVMSFLIKKKKEGQFLKFWNGWEQGLELIKSKEMWIMTGWEPIVFAAQKLGVDAKYAIPKEGYEGWSNDLLLHRGAKEEGLLEAAHNFANWELSGSYGCALAELRGYVVPSDLTLSYAQNHPKLFDFTKQKNIVDNVKWKFQQMKGNVYWQNVRPKNYILYEKWWSQLRNA